MFPSSAMPDRMDSTDRDTILCGRIGCLHGTSQTQNFGDLGFREFRATIAAPAPVPISTEGMVRPDEMQSLLMSVPIVISGASTDQMVGIAAGRVITPMTDTEVRTEQWAIGQFIGESMRPYRPAFITELSIATSAAPICPGPTGIRAPALIDISPEPFWRKPATGQGAEACGLKCNPRWFHEERTVANFADAFNEHTSNLPTGWRDPEWCARSTRLGNREFGLQTLDRSMRIAWKCL